MAGNIYYDPTEDMWPDLKQGRVILQPVRVGVDRTTGKMIVGWPHVKQSIFVIVSTRYHTRVLRRWVGCFIPHLLGESALARVITKFYWAIATALDLWEPNYRIQRVWVGKRPDGSLLTSAEELRLGHISTVTEGVYRPRAHLGDNTPEDRRSLDLLRRPQMWG